MGAQAGELSSSSHSREGLGVPGPDLFSCFCVSVAAYSKPSLHPYSLAGQSRLYLPL